MSTITSMRLPGSWGGKGKVHAVRVSNPNRTLCGRATKGMYEDPDQFDSFIIDVVCTKCRQRYHNNLALVRQLKGLPS